MKHTSTSITKQSWRASATALLLAGAACAVACGSSDQSGSAGSAGSAGSGGAGSGGEAGDSSLAGSNAGEGGAAGAGTSSSAGEAGASSGGVGGDSSTGTIDGTVTDYLNGLPDWGAIPPASDTASPAVNQLRDLKNSAGTHPFECSVVTHDIVEDHEEILNLDSGAEYVKPGVILVGNEFQKGNLEPIPLARTPIKLSINVPGVTDATVVVQDPNVSNIQQGLATLQANAEKSAGSSYAAQLSYEQHSVQSVQEMAVDVGIAAGFDGLFTSVDFSSKFSEESTTQKYTVVAKLMQQMYTITFAQDDFPSPSAFFSPSLTLADVQGAVKSGYLGPSNPPVFIGSVTYGRMVVFSATSTQVSSSQELEANLQASGASWSTKDSLTDAQKTFLSTLDIQVLSVGGNQATVTAAIKSGNWSDLYADADILSSVPLRYTVHALTGTRPIAAIGDTTQFSVADCSAVQGWYQVPGPAGVTFTDVSTNPANSPVVAIGKKTADATYAVYKLNGEEFDLEPGFSGARINDVTVDDDGNSFMIVDHDATLPQLFRNQAGQTTWTPGIWNQAAMGGIDAGSANWVVGLGLPYSDNQRDFWDQYWPADWAYRVDDAQNDVSGGGPYFSAAGNQYYYVYYGGPQIESRTDNNIVTVVSQNHAEVNKIVQLSVLNASTISALLNTNQIGLYDKASDSFKTTIAPPTNKTLGQIEITSNGQFWAITTDGAMYHYIP